MQMFGHAVYTCFQLTVPNAPPADLHDCLKHGSGNQYTYEPVPGSPLHLTEFLSPDRKIWCVLDNTRGDKNASCAFATPPIGSEQEYSARLQPNGKLTTCNWQPPQSGLDACVQNWDNSAPVLKTGQVDVEYAYRCKAAAAAVTCKVDVGAGRGKGFTITASGVTPITP
jgi:hypothetical protein